MSRDGGKNWSDISPNLAGVPKNGWVAQIKPSTFTKGEAYAVINNYRNFDFKPYLLRTRNYGKTWENLLKDKSDTFGYSLSLIQDPLNKNLIFLGTENGLYVSLNEGRSWTKWTENYPSVPTMDMVIHPREHDLAIATFGRSFYVLDDIRPLREMSDKGADLLNKGVKLFEPPTAYISEYQQPSGSRFGGNAIFNGENRKRGAMISYVINKKEAPKETAKDTTKDSSVKGKKDKAKDTIVLNIYDQKDTLIRTLKFKSPKENGLHRTYWSLNEKGAFSPSRSVVKTNREPSGVTVLPGDYKLVMHFQDQKDSTQIKVGIDPRIQISDEVLREQYRLLKLIEQKKDLVYRSIEQLKSSKTTVADIKKQAENNDKELHKDLIKLSDSIQKTIDSLIDQVMGKEDKRQGITSSENPSNISYLYTANSYVRSLRSMPGKTEMQLIQNADSKLDPVIKSINDFYAKDWSAYREKVEQTDLSLFKEYQILE